MYTGVAGSLGAIAVPFVAPDSFSVFAVDHAVRGPGGRRRRHAAGGRDRAAFLTFVPNFSEQISKSAPGLAYGVLLVAVLYVMPSGIAGLATTLLRRYRAARAAGDASVVT